MSARTGEIVDLVAAGGTAAATLPETPSLTSAATAKRRATPPRQVKLILPVWGYAFIRQFLEVGLPTLLAPGNVPALAKRLPTEFVILTSFEDEAYLAAHPAFRRLAATCPTELRRIDHLITGSNYSTTITLAYAEAVRAAGDAVTDTCFFFLVSDYIMADGSFGHVLDRVMAGASGILVGNFNVAQEDAQPWLLEQLTRSPETLTLEPRQLMRWALSHLHPVTVANTVNYPLNRSDQTNRLFWRVDGNTLLGRFYLMHMIAIRPEVADFVVGSACDYSFIPEMCPSDNVEIITDSDEYLVIEMQPRAHETSHIRPGPPTAPRLAKALSQWTTVRHRKNALTSVIFHAEDVPTGAAIVDAEASAFVAKIAELSGPPRPFRHHPYWKGALAAFKDATGKPLSLEEWRLVLGLPNPELSEGWITDWMVERIRFVLFGRPPRVRRWHPRWPDYQLVMDRLDGTLSAEDTRLLLLSDVPTVFTASLGDGGERVVRVRTSHFLRNPAEVYEPLSGAFDMCLIELTEGELEKADELVDRIARLMKPDGRILLMVYNKRQRDVSDFGRSVSYHAPRLMRPAASIAATSFVLAGRARWAVLKTVIGLGKMASRRPVIGVPLLAVLGIPVAAAIATTNLIHGGRTSAKPNKRGPTSALIELTVDPAIAGNSHLYSASRITRQRQRLRRLGRLRLANEALVDAAQPKRRSATPAPAQPPPTPGPGASTAASPRANVSIMQANQTWRDDPRQLAFLLARYKFVAKMLSGRQHVADVSANDAFGVPVVLQEVDRVDVYNADPAVIEEVRRRTSAEWPTEGHVHDIILEPLAERHEAVYSFDLLATLDPADEHAFLANLRGSLTDDGVLIIGTPSVESRRLSPTVSSDHNFKTGDQLKALLERYFTNVFLFSMNDEVVQTGADPTAHYYLGLCTGKR